MTNEFTFLMLPPQTDLTRQWARRLSDSVPGMKLVLAEDRNAAAAAIVTADAAFGTLPADLLAKARRLRWLQAPQAAPPAGYYYSELVSHPLTVTNFREIYNDHISAHILAFVLAFARGLHVYIPQQLRREWKKPGEDRGVVPLPGATALIVGLGGIGAETARLLSAFGMRVLAVDARRTERPEQVAELHPPEGLDRPAATGRFCHPDGAAHAGDRRFLQHDKVPADEAGCVLHQHRSRHDDEAGRSGGGVKGRRNRWSRAGRVRAGTAPGRAPAMGDAERAADAAHGRIRPASERATASDHRRQLSGIREWRTVTERRRQGELVLVRGTRHPADLMWVGCPPPYALYKSHRMDPD